MNKQWWGIYAITAIAVVFLALPVIALLIRVPWAEFPALMLMPETIQASLLSLGTSAVSALLCVVLGTSIGIWLSERESPVALLVRIAVIVPLVMPPLVGGVALLATFGQHGLLGEALHSVGIRVPFSTSAVILAQVFVALPFMVVTVEAAKRSARRNYAAVARDLGASRWLALTRVTIPLLKAAIIGGFLLCLARALGEYGATSLFAGSAPGITRTLPQAIAGAFQGTSNQESMGYAMSGLLVICAVVIVALSGMWKTPRGSR